MSLKHSYVRFLFAILLTGCIVFSVGGNYGIAQETGEDQVSAAGAGTASDAGAASPGVQQTPTQAADGLPTDEAIIAQGQSLFRQNCTVCHAINDIVVGPALGGVHTRRSTPWLISFIRNSQKLIKSGDPDAVELYNRFNKTEMPAFSFSDEEIISILAYIKQETDRPADTAAGPDGGLVVQDRGVDSGVPTTIIQIVLFGVLFILLLVVGVLILVVSVLSNQLSKREDLDEADKEVINQRVDIKKTLTSGPFIGIVSFIFVAIVLKAIVDGLFTIGVQQGYAPTQPIAFSHALHAGQYEIDCNYCHTGVRKGKQANIPSSNICMNCHSAIKTESPEIQKIYAALENDRPIEWVRIHNLPDLAYFNHAQHVNVANLECQTCHGEIQEMEVVRQASPLTMGWCINCHRETNVNTAGNAYYDKLVEIHAEVKGREPMKVQDIGGLECSRCHY
jgi:mono/diheme cytochrome c family protein